jgi:hypothetical protein
VLLESISSISLLLTIILQMPGQNFSAATMDEKLDSTELAQTTPSKSSARTFLFLRWSLPLLLFVIIFMELSKLLFFIILLQDALDKIIADVPQFKVRADVVQTAARATFINLG